MTQPDPAPPRTDNLAQRATRGIVVTMGGLWGRALLQTLSTIVLARLLTPADFGLLAMVASIMGVAELVRDFGMTGAIIQAQNLSDRVWKSLLWISALMGATLGLLVALCAPLVAALYGEPQLVGITLLMAPGVFLSGLVAPLQALASKQLKFVTLAALDIGTMLAGVIVGIVMAILGFGFWALVGMAGAQFLVRIIVMWVIVKPKWGPPKIVREAWSLVGTGGSIFGAELLGYAEKNLDNVIIGATLGPAALGQYSRAYALFLLPLQQMNGPLGRVALPVLSTLRNDGDRYRRYIRSAALVIGYLTLPTYAVASGVAQPLVQLLLGPGWEIAATVFSLLAIAGFAQAIGRLRTWLYISLGHSHRQFMYDLVARPIVIGGYFFGIWWGGLNGLVITYGILSIVMLIPGFAWAMRDTFVKGSDVVMPLIRPLIMALVAVAASYGFSRLIPTPIALLEVIVGCLGALVAVSPLFLIPGYRRDLASLWAFVGRMRGSKGPKNAADAPTGVDAPLADAATPEAEAASEAMAEVPLNETFSETVMTEQRIDDDAAAYAAEITEHRTRAERRRAARTPADDPPA